MSLQVDQLKYRCVLVLEAHVARLAHEEGFILGHMSITGSRNVR